MAVSDAEIILAAIQAAGPVNGDPAGWDARVNSMAGKIAVLTGEKSSVIKTIEGIRNAKVFPAHIVGVRKEASSTRGVVTVFTGTDRDNSKNGVPQGCEQFRTERTDSPEGLAMAREVRDLIGHHVLVWIQVEDVPGKDFKVRVVRNVQSLGLSKEPLAQEALAAKQAQEAAQVRSVQDTAA